MPRWVSLLGVALLLVANGWLLVTGLRTGSDEAPPDAAVQRWFVTAGPGLSTSQGGGAYAVTLALDPRAQVLTLPNGSFTLDAGRKPGPIIQQLRGREDLSQYDHILVQGGELDFEAPEESLRIATVHLFDYLRAVAGEDTSLTLVGPISRESGSSEEVRRVNDTLRRAAADTAVHYVDAVESRLYADDPAMPRKLAKAVLEAVGEGDLVDRRPFPSSSS